MIYLRKLITFGIFNDFLVDYFYIVAAQNRSKYQTTDIDAMKNEFDLSYLHRKNCCVTTRELMTEIFVLCAIGFNKFTIRHHCFRLI